MNHHAEPGLLDRISEPSDMKNLSIDQLRRLADEVRTETIRHVACTGGHLGASLGVVELTVALHHIFDTPRDRLIWDVGHQCYPHKILTGRRGRMATLRQGGGLSGFTRRSESPYDPFGAAHSSTSISAGLGMAAARDLKHDDRRVICVIGDGALSAGMAFEALNNLGASGRRVIVILNDNGMSIAPAVGALTEHLAALAAGQAGGNLFESLGLRYQGPIDGHDLARLVPALRALRDEEPAAGPVLLHVLTRKGKGFAPAEAAADKYHGVGCFDPVTGHQHKAPAKAPPYTRVFADALIAEAARDPAIVAVTAGMPSGTGLDRFAHSFPDRCFDAGIAEQHAVTFAAGLAAEGMKPFAAIYSTFLQRGYDQVVHDVVLQKLPVRFAIDRAGLVGQDGPTHMGSYDLAFLCCLPGMTVMAPSDETELVHMVATAAAFDDGPCAVRYPRGEGHGLPLPERGTVLEIGKGRILREGTQVAILALGPRLAEALRAAEALAGMGIAATVADARFAKPLDGELIARLAREHEVLITIEDGAAGGFAAHVGQFLAWCGLLDRGLKFRPITMPDRFIEQDGPEAQARTAGLTAGDIAATALGALGQDDGAAARRLFIV